MYSIFAYFYTKYFRYKLFPLRSNRGHSQRYGEEYEEFFGVLFLTEDE